MEFTNDKSNIKEVAINGQTLLADLHYKQEMKLLNISLLSFGRRKLFTQEFQALYIALWRLALSKSFPDSCNEIYNEFLQLDWVFAKSNQKHILAHSEMFYEKLLPKGIEDFSEVARHFLSLTPSDDTLTKAQILRIALHIRTKYYYFFNNLL